MSGDSEKPPVKKSERFTISKKESKHAKQTRESIADQTMAFLQAGGTIQEIPSGVSGVESLGLTHGNKGQKSAEDAEPAENTSE